MTENEVQRKTYEDGLREGRLRGIEETITDHGERIAMLERRAVAQERITFGLLGALALFQLLPTLKAVTGG